jgi:hypothetical protein
MESDKQFSSLRKQSTDSQNSAQYRSSSDVHIPGFMDYDPKAAARTAHDSNQQSRYGGERSWFHL